MSAQNRRSKRGNGDGSVYEKRPGLFCAQVSYRRQGSLKRKTKYFQSKTDAKNWIREQSTAKANGSFITAPPKTFAKFADEWLQRRKSEVRRGVPLGMAAVPVKQSAPRKTIAPSTWKGLNDRVRLVSTQPLYNMQIAAIETDDIDDLLETLLLTYSAQSVKNVRAVLSNLFRAAKRAKEVASNPVTDSNPIYVGEYQQHVLDEDQALRFVEEAKGDELEALFRVGVAIGFRRGEAFGLTWADCHGSFIDIKSQLQTIPRALRADPETVEYVHLPPKWGSGRVVQLPQVLVDVLKEHKDRQDVLRKAAGDKWQDNDLVFCTNLGRPLQGSEVKKRHFAPICERAGIPVSYKGKPGLRLHDLRVSAASILLAQGIDAPTVMDILGQKSVAVFLHYLKILKGQKAASAEKLQALFARKNDAPSSHAQ